MLKIDEKCDPVSCWNKMRDDQIIFILTETDIATPDTIRDWAERRIQLGRNKREDAQIQSALQCADRIEKRRQL